ncbi:complement C1q tumor necrosis factor-related protein 3-like [Saccostrea cucullata]|uniref:complement C1q tumor necrosis factor-related protein 3-like n=1 Tax=Saccostrea cuccullata TaxID=36930 RepID=UPI002ED1F778
MHSVVFAVGLGAIFGTISTEKISPGPSLKSFRDDYDNVAKTCEAVGYVKNYCKYNQFKRNIVIAFYAQAKGSTQTLRERQTVMFQDVNLNIGGGYNATKGFFNAPKSGVYVFEWTILTPQNKYAYTSLVLNGKRKAYSYCHNNNHSLRSSCSKMTVVKMVVGDKAWIDNNSRSLTSVSAEYSSFSGFML